MVDGCWLVRRCGLAGMFVDSDWLVAGGLLK